MKKEVGLIETMYWDGKCITLWDLHYHRFSEGIAAFEIPFFVEEKTLYAALEKEIAHTRMTQKIRMHLSSEGLLSITDYPFERTDLPVDIGIAEDCALPAFSINKYKTDDREIYEKAYLQARATNDFDMLLKNVNGNIAEGSFTNIFWKNKNDEKLYTPPFSEGCLDGVMRKNILSKNDCAEGILTIEILQNAEQVFVCNALRGVLPVNKIGTYFYDSDVSKIAT